MVESGGFRLDSIGFLVPDIDDYAGDDRRRRCAGKGGFPLFKPRVERFPLHGIRNPEFSVSGFVV